MTYSVGDLRVLQPMGLQAAAAAHPYTLQVALMCKIS